MSTINVQCIDQTLTITGSPLIASGGVNEDSVAFSFDSSWEGFAKTAVFYVNKDAVYQVAVGEDDSCVVPYEVLVNPGTMYFGVFGVSGDVTRTSEVLPYSIKDGAVLSGITPNPPPDIYQQLLEEIDNLGADLEALDKSVQEEIRALDRSAEALNRRITNLEYAAKGYLYRDEVDNTVAYKKTVPDDTMPYASIDKIGGRSVVWNQHIDSVIGEYAEFPNVNNNFSFNVSFRASHKYLIREDAHPTNTAYNKFQYASVGFWNSSKTKYTRIETNNSRVNGRYEGVLKFNLPANSDESEFTQFVFQYITHTPVTTVDSHIAYRNFQLIDLTTWFGEEIANTITTPEQAYALGVPRDPIPYNGGEIVSAKVNQVTSAKSTFSFNSRIYLPTTDGGNSFSIIHDGIEHDSLNYEALLYGSILVFETPSGEEPLTVDLENVETRFDEESQMDVFVSGDLPSNFDNNFIVKSLDDSSVLGGWFGENGTFNVSTIGIYTVPEAVRNLPLYGASAGPVYNEVDFVNKKYIQRVGAVTFDGTENWAFGGTLQDLSDRYYSSPKIEGAAYDNGTVVKVVAPLTEGGTSIANGRTAIGYGMTWGFFRYRPQNVQAKTINEWKAILNTSPLTVYYALENPIIIDISDLLADDNYIQVDGDGSITFEQEDDTEIPVPNTETFLIKLGGADNA